MTIIQNSKLKKKERKNKFYANPFSSIFIYRNVFKIVDWLIVFFIHCIKIL